MGPVRQTAALKPDPDKVAGRWPLKRLHELLGACPLHLDRLLVFVRQHRGFKFDRADGLATECAADPAAMHLHLVWRMTEAAADHIPLVEHIL